MRDRENYTPFVAIGLGLTLGIMAVFQLYVMKEPERIQHVQAEDAEEMKEAGRILYDENCTACHGEIGEGGIGPALNSKALLSTTSDESIFNLTLTGVPGTVMPAWGQAFGGPFTDEEARQITAYIRSWEPNALDIEPVVFVPDPVRGAEIFASTCFICHGVNGMGTEIGPRLNDPDRLGEFDADWFRATIAAGRPAKGMPTWGTVMSPQKIDDVVALLMAWRDGIEVEYSVSIEVRLSSALLALQQNDSANAIFHLTAALESANEEQAEVIRVVLELLAENDRAGAMEALFALFPPEEFGEELYASNCASCHAADGTGGFGTNLHANVLIQSMSDAELLEFLMVGRPGTAMPGFEGSMTEEQIAYLIAFLRSWQE